MVWGSASGVWMCTHNVCSDRNRSTVGDCQCPDVIRVTLYRKRHPASHRLLYRDTAGAAEPYLHCESRVTNEYVAGHSDRLDMKLA